MKSSIRVIDDRLTVRLKYNIYNDKCYKNIINVKKYNILNLPH